MKPQLRPQDLEDLANIFDRLRVLYRKKEDQILPPPKKLIAKGMGKVDDLAIEFDQKLTSIMISLSGVLQDPLVTTSQKRAEIEKSKFLLYNYCCETIVKYLAKHRASITGKDAKELQSILSKVREGLSTSFLNLGSLFYSKEEREVQATCEEEMKRINTMMQTKERELKEIEQSLTVKHDAAQSQVSNLTLTLKTT